MVLMELGKRKYCLDLAIIEVERLQACTVIESPFVNGLYRTGEVDALDGAVADEGPRRNLAHAATNMDILHVGIGGEGARGNLLHQVGRAVDGDVAIDAVVAVAEGRRAGDTRRKARQANMDETCLGVLAASDGGIVEIPLVKLICAGTEGAEQDGK